MTMHCSLRHPSGLRNMPKSNEPNTLIFLLQALCGSHISFELRDGVLVEGVLDSVDANMNATVVDASYKPKSVHNPDGATNSSGADAMNFSLLYIAARHIMFIHIPENVDIAETMDIHARRREAAEYASSGGKRRRRT